MQLHEFHEKEEIEKSGLDGKRCLVARFVFGIVELGLVDQLFAVGLLVHFVAIVHVVQN